MRKILMLILGMITFVPVFSQDCSFTEADFIVSGVSLDSICLKEPVTFVDSSYGDSCCWEWDFGDGADHPPGTQGEGPFSVRYNTPGEKIVRLSMVDKCGNIRENSGLIEVLPEVTLDTIIGPGILCEGTEAYFETMYSSYIDQYVWSVPDHAVILSGQSTNKIWVMLGDTSGEVTVYGEYPCGKTTTLTKNIKVNNIGDIDFLFVTGEDHQSLSVVDSLLLEKITGMGYSVWVKEDTIVKTSDALCVTAVIFSPHADTAVIKDNFKEIYTPVVVMNPLLLPYFGMSGEPADSIVYGKDTLTSIHIITNSHEISGGMALGAVDVYTESSAINWGKPLKTAGVVKIAETAENNSKYPVYAFEKDAYLYKRQTDSLIANERRAAFLIPFHNAVKWTTNADKLLSNTLCWVNYTCPVIPSGIEIDTLILADTVQLCENINVKFTSTGLFAHNNRYIVQLSNAFGSFAGGTENIGEIADSNTLTAFTISAQIPGVIFEGSDYKIRVVTTDPVTESSSSERFCIVDPLKDLNPVIHGPDSVCKNTLASFSIDTFPKGYNYHWEVPLGARIVAPEVSDPWFINYEGPSNTITVDLGTATSSKIVVKPYHCTSTPYAYDKMIYQKYDSCYYLDAPSSIKGEDTVCQQYSGVYSVDSVPGASRYLWAVTPEIQIIGMDTLNEIMLSFSNTTEHSYNKIIVYALNDSMNSTYSEMQVEIDNLITKPKVGEIRDTFITGNTYRYYVDTVPEAITYDWVLPSFATGLSYSNEIEVTYSKAVQDSIGVSIIGQCGISDTSFKYVDISMIIKEIDENGLSLIWYPNPSKNKIIVEYYVDQKEKIHLSLLNTKGSIVKQLINNEMNPGRYRDVYNISSISSGIYYLKLQTSERCLTGKLIVK